MSIKYSIKYDGKMFDSIEPKVAKKHLRKAIQEIASGTSGNPLYSHFLMGQSTWNEDSPEYAKQKKAKTGSDYKFKLTGEALKGIIAKSGRTKKFAVSYRKKKDYFLLTATIRKMVGGKNVYTIAQNGRFAGIIGKSGDKEKFVSKDDFLETLSSVNKAFAEVQEADETVSRSKLKAFRKALIKEKYAFNNGSTQRVSRNQRLISANLPGDDRLVKLDKMNKHIEQIIKESGYKLS